MKEARETKEGKDKNRSYANKVRSIPEGKASNLARVANTRQRNMKTKAAGFQGVQGSSMVDPEILNTDAYKLIERHFFKCEICGGTLNYKRSVIKMKSAKYNAEILLRCYKTDIKAKVEREQWMDMSYM